MRISGTKFFKILWDEITPEEFAASAQRLWQPSRIGKLTIGVDSPPLQPCMRELDLILHPPALLTCPI